MNILPKFFTLLYNKHIWGDFMLFNENKNKEFNNNIPPLNEALDVKLEWFHLIFIYVIGGVIGTVWETLLNLVRGDGFVYCNGTIFTPFNFVYGTGAAVIILTLRKTTSPSKVFLYGAIGGGVVEYILSFLEELILQTRSWDYHDEWLNINGRTTLPFMLFWGLLSLTAVYVLYRPLLRLMYRFKQQALSLISKVLLSIIVIDMSLTVVILVRYASRMDGNPPANVISETIDKYFDNEYMQLHFPSMEFQK